MTGRSRRSGTPAAQAPTLATLGPRHRRDCVTALTCYLLLLFGLPSSLVVGALGAAGQPAGLFAGFLLIWYLAFAQRRSFLPVHGRQPITMTTVLLGCSVFAAYISANRSAMSALEVNAADRGLIALTGWLGILLLAADGIDSAGRLAVLLRRIVLGATAVAALGIAEFCTGIDVTRYVTLPGLTVHHQATDLMMRAGLPRVTATASQPLEFSAVLAMSLPLAIHQARWNVRSRWPSRWLPVALITAAIPMAVSRSALISLVVVAVMLVPTWPKRQQRRVYLGVLSLPVIAWLVLPSMLGGFAAIFGQLGSDSSSRSRGSALSSAIPLIAQHPWFGQGLQTFFPQNHFFVDDQFLTMLIETGFTGLLALIALFAAGLLGARWVRLTCADDRTADLGHCLTAALAAAVVSFATFDVLSFSLATGLFFLLLGCTASARRLVAADRAVVVEVRRPGPAALPSPRPLVRQVIGDPPAPSQAAAPAPDRAAYRSPAGSGVAQSIDRPAP
jgi:O-antigen ligase